MKNLRSKNVLFLEDNDTFAENTIKALDIYFNEIIHCVSIVSAKKLFNEEFIDIIICDLEVTDGNSLEFIKYVRKKNKEIPIIILSAHKDINFVLEAIPLNLISYELKPLDMNKFKQLLQTCSEHLSDKQELLQNSIYYDQHTRSIIEDGVEEKLTKNEVKFLELLIENRGKIVLNEIIEEAIWKDKTITNSALKNLIFRLRKKATQEMFTKVQNVGYKL